MSSFAKLAVALVLAGGLAAPAFAASTDTTTGSATTDQNATGGASKMNNGANADTTGQGANAGATGQTANPGSMRMADKLRTDLSKAGYTDITIRPSGFMIRAKDSQGNPVMMMISPDSVTAISEEIQGASSASNANHANQNNTGADTGSQPAQPNATKP